jgi:nitroreductase
MAKGASIVDAAITGRRSIRKFLAQSVDRELVEQILEVAARAPSGTNMQPWQVHVVAGKTMSDLSNALLDAHNNHKQDHSSEYSYYPDTFAEPFKSRRKKVGIDLYGLLGIKKGAVAEMKTQHGRNYLFFDAPVGLMFTIDRTLKIGSWLDYGMFLQNIMIAARARGLDTCPQAAFAQYHRIVRDHLDIAEQQIVVCGMSLGYIDVTAVENQLETEREPVSGFTRFHGL